MIRGHRTDVVLLVGALLLLGLSMIVASALGSRKTSRMISGMLLAMSVLALGLSFTEWYLRHPNKAALIMPAEVRAIERRYAEPEVGLRTRPGRRLHLNAVPYGNIIWTKQDPRIVEQERRMVEVFMDENGFPNSTVPQKADIITLGDSFTKCADVRWKEGWVHHVEESTGSTIYNISCGGFCPSQEVELYARYGAIDDVSLVLLGVYGINDLGDENRYWRFRASGMTVKQWAYYRARHLYPGRTFGFVQLFRTWLLKGRNKRLPGSNAPIEELDPITISNIVRPTKVSYYPNYQTWAHECATTDLVTYPAAMSLVSSIRRLAEMSRQQQRMPAVLYFPLKQTIHPPSSDEQAAWIEFLRHAVPEARAENWSDDHLVEFGRVLLQGDRRFASYLAEVCDSLDIPFHSVIAAFEESVKETGELHYYHFDTHWNAKGHACAGESIAAWLARTFHQLSTEAADMAPPASLRSVGRFAAKAGEKSGLKAREG